MKLMPDKCPFCGEKHYGKHLVVVDLDGTLCIHAEPCDGRVFKSARPLKKRIKFVQKIKSLGHHVIIFTGRPEKWRKVTEWWLKKNKVPYDFLFMEKSGYIFSLDDKMVLTSWIGVERNEDKITDKMDMVCSSKICRICGHDHAVSDGFIIK